MSWQGAVERTVVGMGYELVDAEKGAGGLLRVTIDVAPPVADGAGAAEPAITVDDCEKVTRQLQHVLEVEGCDYARLEVSSPGLDRPLKKASDYLRFAGAQIEITLKQPFNGRKKYRGELQAAEADAEAFRLLLAGDEPPARPGAKTAARKARAAAAPEGAVQVLDFSLDEVREARLVPVLDFKGRRFAAQGEAAVPHDKG
jgi:ribosome maturation factor RimP